MNLKNLFCAYLVLTLPLMAIAQSLDSSFGNESLDSSFTQPGGLTDQQANDSQSFVHQGRKDAVLNKACKEANGVCESDSADKTKVLLPTIIENNIGKLYTVLFGGMSLMSGGPKVKLAPSKTAPAAGGTAGANAGAGAGAGAGSNSAAGAKAEKNEATDYCLYIAMANEGLATVLQSSQQKQAEQDSAALNDPQVQALVNLKETHKARKRTATFQSAFYGATAACYAARKLLQPAVVMDAKYIIKMAAAGGISMLYLKKADKHADAMKKIQKVIDSLPKAGDCNPWTGTACFCKESTSQKLYPGQYQEVCMLNNGIADGPKANLGCGFISGGKVQADPSCTCKANNTCISAQLKFANPTIGLGSNLLNSANAGYALLDPSQFDEGKLRDYSIGASALNSKFKPKGTIPDVTLTPEQKAIADSLKDVVPAAVANYAATAPASNVGADAQMGSAGSSALSALPESIKKRISDSEISGNYRSKGGSTVTGDGEQVPFTMPGMGGEKADAGGTEVLSFAEKAINNADVSNRPDTPIFDIISNRYRSSGWTKLQKE